MDKIKTKSDEDGCGGPGDEKKRQTEAEVLSLRWIGSLKIKHGLEKRGT